MTRFKGLLASDRSAYVEPDRAAFTLVLNIWITSIFVHRFFSVSGETALKSVWRCCRSLKSVEIRTAAERRVEGGGVFG